MWPFQGHSIYFTLDLRQPKHLCHFVPPIQRCQDHLCWLDIHFANQGESQSTWAMILNMTETQVLVGGLFGPLSGVVAENLGVKPCLIIGCLIYTWVHGLDCQHLKPKFHICECAISGGYFLTFWSLDIGLWACAITIAAGHGIGYGLTYPVSVAATLKVRWMHLSKVHCRSSQTIVYNSVVSATFAGTLWKHCCLRIRFWIRDMESSGNGLCQP